MDVSALARSSATLLALALLSAAAAPPAGAAAIDASQGSNARQRQGETPPRSGARRDRRAKRHRRTRRRHRRTSVRVRVGRVRRDRIAPSAPAGLTAAPGDGRVDLAWRASTDNVGVAGYRVYRDAAFAGSTASPAFADAGLANGVPHTYHVRAVDAAGNLSPASASVAAAAQAPAPAPDPAPLPQPEPVPPPPPADVVPPAAPGGLVAVAGDTRVSLSWTAASDDVGVTGYRVYRGATPVGAPAGTSFTDTGLVNGTAYTYTVTAVDAAGNQSGSSLPASATPVGAPVPPPAGTVHYVSRANTSSTADGASWATAWKELGQIAWSSVAPGDTILIDGGSTPCPSNYDFADHGASRPGLRCGMLYTTQLNVQRSGTADAPITIRLASDAGRNGTAVVFGGRPNALPYCTQPGYTPGGSARADGIVFNTRATGARHVVLDGAHRSGIMVYGAQTGVNLVSDATSHVTLRNLEIFDNGTHQSFSGGGSATDNPGVFLNGTKVTIERVLIHDNGQDEIQDNYTGAANGHAPIDDLTIRDAWIYNRRDHPGWTGYPFNSGAEGTPTDCTHVDGLQIWGGGRGQRNLTIRDSVFGPLLAQSIYPSDTSTSFDHVTLSNLLHLNPVIHGVIGERQGGTSATPANWVISNMTTYMTASENPNAGGSPSHGTELYGTGHSLTNSIFHYGYFVAGSAFTGLSSGNLYYGGDPVPGGTSVAPRFAAPPAGGNAPTYAQLAAGDYTPTCTSCAGKGSSLHGVQDILNRIDQLNGT
jgi:chitodextrinase